MSSSMRACGRVLAIPLAFVMLFVSMPLSAVKAEMVTTEQVIQGRDAISDRERVARFLHQKVVRDQMVALGVDPSEVDARMATLSDQEMTQIAGKIGELPAGQASSGDAVIYVLALVVLILLLLLLL